MSVASMTKFMHRISFVAALLLSLSLSMAAQAASPLAKPDFTTSTHDDGSSAISNGDFIYNDQCSLDSWTFSDNTSPYLDRNEGCVASLDSDVSTSPTGPARQIISTMSQTFIVPDSNGLYMDIIARVRPESNRPNTRFDAQTISLYDAKGSLVYSKSHNSNSSTWLIFNYHLGGYANQEMTLEFQTVADTSTSESPSRSKLYVDKVGVRITVKPPIPNTGPGGGW